MPENLITEEAMSEEELLSLFKRHGIKIELGATYSVKCQIAQLINVIRDVEANNREPKLENQRKRCNEFTDTADYVVQCRWPKKDHIPRAWQEWYDVSRNELDARAFEKDREQLEFYVHRKMDGGDAQYRIVKRTDKELTLFIR